MPDEIMPHSTDAPLTDALRTLQPAATGISRDRLLYDAGRAAASPRLFGVWPIATFLFAGLSAVLAGWMLFSEREPTRVVERERIVEVLVPSPAPPASPLVPAEPRSPNLQEVTHQEKGVSDEARRMHLVRRDVMRWGIPLLPDSRAEPITMTDRRASMRDFERFLELPAGTFSGSPSKGSRLFPNTTGDD